MPPKSIATESSASTNNCRRSKRLSDKINSMAKEQAASSKKEQPSYTKRRNRRHRKKPAVKEQLTSSNKRQSTSTKRNPGKRRRVMEVDEINDLASQMGQNVKENFSTAIKQILKELSPDLEIADEAITDMNIYLNHIFDQLARASAIFPLGRSTVSSLCMTVKDIETSLPHVIEGELGKYCIAEGRRAVKKWNEAA